MGDGKDGRGDRTQRDQDVIDRYELGEVNHVTDLEPESQVGPSRKKHEQQRLLNPTSVGYFEIEAGASGNLGAPIHIGPELKKDGGPRIARYESAYNSYAQPLQSTLRAMGRVKDISLTGAPLTPAELARRPDLAARFRKLEPSRGDDVQEQAFNQWSSHQTAMKHKVERFGAGQHEMMAVIADYTKVQKLLQQRQAEAAKGANASELQQIQQAAATLAKIVDVSLEAWNFINVVEAEVGRQFAAFDESADGVVLDDYPSGNPNWVHGTIDDPGATNGNVSRRGHHTAARALGGVHVVPEFAKTLRDKVRTSTQLPLSLDGMFITAMGNAKRYGELKTAIAELERQIQALEFEQEAQTIRSASERLIGFKMEFVVRRQEVKAERDASRRAAKAFGKSMKGETAGITAMYAAEAYQELAAFGALAAQQRRDMVDPLVPPVRQYLTSTDPHRYQAIGAERDAHALAANIQSVQEQRQYFSTHLPQWQKVAHQWSDFLASNTGTPLITEANEADRRSTGP